MKFKYPIRVCWEITGRCNYSCIHCYHEGESKLDDLDYQQAKRLLRCIKNNVPELSIGGGEPLLYPNIDKLINPLAKYINIYISTNGSLINEATIKKFSKKIIFQVSIDGLKDTHDFIRHRAGGYERAIAAVKTLITYRYTTGVNITISKMIISEIPRLVSILKTIGVRNFHFNTYIGTHKKLILSAVDIKRANKILNDLSHDKKITISIRDPLFDICPGPCQAYKTTINICANGDVTPCCYISKKLGNVKKESLRDVWDRIARDINTNKQINTCRRCDKWLKCQGGCMARRHSNSVSDYICPNK